MSDFLNVMETTNRENLSRLTCELHEGGLQVRYMAALEGVYEGQPVRVMEKVFDHWAEIAPYFEDMYGGHTLLLYDLSHTHPGIRLRFAWV
jgi:hypothetical protein